MTGEFQAVVQRDLPRFYRQALRLTQNAHDAEDAVQDALLSAHKNLSRFKGDAKLSTWITSIVINAALQQKRSARPRVFREEQLGCDDDGAAMLEAYADGKPNPEASCLLSERHRMFSTALMRLSPKLRATLVDFYVDGKSLGEIADQTQLPLGTLKARLARARAMLTKMIEVQNARS